MARSDYQLGMYEKSMPNTLSLGEKLNMCRECGFDWLELSIDETDEKLARLEWGQEERSELRHAMESEGVQIRTMCLSGHRKYPLGSSDPEIEKRGMEIMAKAIDLAADLGIRIIQLAGYDVYYETGNDETRERFINNLKKAAVMASRRSVMMGFETMETPFMDTVEKAMIYVNAVNSPYLQVYPDIGNLTNASLIYSTSVTDDLMKGSGHIAAAHLKETVPGKYREIPFGTGHTDYGNDIRCLKKLGVRMFTGEFWYVGQEDWQKTCMNASAFLRKQLDEVFNEEKYAD